VSASVVDSPAVPGPVPPDAPERQSEIADLEESTGTDLIERAWRVFVSLKLMVVLMGLFALAMAAGTFINPKEDALADIERVFAAKPWVITLYRIFELYAPFKSWWFTTILVLLALNNLASSIERLPRIFLIVRNPERRLTDRVLRGIRHKKTFARGELDADKVEGVFQKAGYKVTRIVEDGVTYLFGERGASARFGVWVVHIALLVVCVGGVYGRFFSYEGTMDLPENGGQQSFIRMREPDGTIIPKNLVDPEGHRFSVRCDNFDLDRFKDGSARRFASDLTVLDDQGRETVKKRIIVNDPLEYGEMKFYQASYQERPDQSHAVMTLTDRVTGEKKEFRASPQEPFSLGNGAVRFTVVNYEKAFGELGPAVQVLREEGPPPVLEGKAPAGGDTTTAMTKDGTPAPKLSNFWVFANYPKFDGDLRGDRFALTFDKLEPSYVTGLQVGFDPGVKWIYLGCFMLWGGLFWAFWSVHRRVWARVEGDKIVLAGAAHRNKTKFAAEFEALLGRLGVSTKA
jgi:cytochrome c biogenesis protein